MHCAKRTKEFPVFGALWLEKRKNHSLLIYNNKGLTNVSGRSILLNIYSIKHVYYSLGDA